MRGTVNKEEGVLWEVDAMMTIDPVRRNSNTIRDTIHVSITTKDRGQEAPILILLRYAALNEMNSASHIVISLQIAPSFLQAKPIQQLTNIHGPPLPHRINLPLLWNQSVSCIFGLLNMDQIRIKSQYQS
jgi:hypothetical protein